MTSSIQLRLRFLAALSSGVTFGVAPVACTSGAKSTGTPHPGGTTRGVDTTRASTPAASTPAASTPAEAATTTGTTKAEEARKPDAPKRAATKDALKPSCRSGQGEVACFAPGSTHFNPGNVPNPGPAPKPHFDGNRCQVRAEVRDGCCNAASSGPELIEGQCCYGFCTGTCCGRPLLVGGVARVAPVSRRADWCEQLNVSVTGVCEPERLLLSRQWLADAQLEHASIASFARFALDLLAFGAPAQLVEGCQRAMADEIQHARACFALASAYAGVSLGPGPLDLSGVAPSVSLAAAAVAALREGCINETIAALTAQEQARGATNLVVRALLERIARDEAEHAELAWRFVDWAIRVGGPIVSRAVAAALQAPSAARVVAGVEPDLRAYGRLSAAESDAIARSAWTEVVLPCSRALTASAFQ